LNWRFDEAGEFGVAAFKVAPEAMAAEAAKADWTNFLLSICTFVCSVQNKEKTLRDKMLFVDILNPNT
jgi:hypothetical protein